MILSALSGWLVPTALVACAALGYATHMLIAYVVRKVAREKATAVLAAQNAAAQARVAEARRLAVAEAERIRRTALLELEEDRAALRELEERLSERSLDLGARDDLLRARRAELDALRHEVRTKEIDLRQLRRGIAQIRAERQKVLLDIVGLSAEEMKRQYLADRDAEVAREMARYLEQRTEALEEEAEARARELVDRVVPRMQLSHAREERPAAIAIPDAACLDRTGIRPGSPLHKAFETATGVEVGFDLEGGTITFTSMDGVRREIARRALGRMVGVRVDPDDEEGRAGAASRKDRRKGRAAEPWTPERIRALVEQVGQEVRRALGRKARKAAQALKLAGNHTLFEYLGRLYFRSSYGQNILRHSQEVGFLGGMLGAEARFDARLARRCAFLHDLGKCIDQETEGGHPEIGARLARECGEDEVVVNAIEAHHDDVHRTTLYPLIVQAADAISGARPGARRRAAEKYLLRMGQIEEIANRKPGVESAYVLQAGREVRVILDADRTTDADAAAVAAAVAHELESEMSFPGKIKVTVIREKKVSAVAQ
ncbi:MAG: DUF3552 domain-containing protein [Planctomycetes bacterium]|nr:DUF3552 domain-containing protein [Planctomycetota bacterium]